MDNPFQNHVILDVNTGNFIEAGIFFDQDTGQLVAPPGYSFVPTQADFSESAGKMKWGDFTFDPLVPDSAQKVFKPKRNQTTKRAPYGTKQKMITETYSKLLEYFQTRDLYVTERHEGSGNTVRVTVKKAEQLKDLFSVTVDVAEEIDLVEVSMHVLERNQKNKKRKSGITIYLQTTCKDDVRLVVQMYSEKGFKATEVGHDPAKTKIVSPVKLKNSDSEEASVILLYQSDQENSKRIKTRSVSPTSLRRKQKMSVELEGGLSVSLNFQKGLGERKKVDKKSVEKLRNAIEKINLDQSVSLSKSTSVSLE